MVKEKVTQKENQAPPQMQEIEVVPLAMVLGELEIIKAKLVSNSMVLSEPVEGEPQ